jgi:hypothetical protein
MKVASDELGLGGGVSGILLELLDKSSQMWVILFFNPRCLLQCKSLPLDQ